MYWRGETFYTKNEIYEGPTEERTVFDQEGADESCATTSQSPRPAPVFPPEKGQGPGGGRCSRPKSRPSFQVVDDGNNKFILAQADLRAEQKSD